MLKPTQLLLPRMKGFDMEVCVEYFESAVNAELGGGIRLELCSALSEGGLTPSVGLLKAIKRKVNIPVCVMIRPRTGNDFIYTEDELAIMKEDIKILKENGADGFVFGVLTKDRKVDVKACRELVECCGDLPATFHRAFDMTNNPSESLEDLIRIGFKRLLTSGQNVNADKGAELIAKLIDQSERRIEIMPGCGVNSDNLKRIVEVTKCSEFHGTGRSSVKKDLPKSDVVLGHVEDESIIYVTDVSKIRKMVDIYNQCKKS